MADTIPGDASTGATITVGGSLTGEIESVGDRDWYRLQLTEGQQVTVLLTGITLGDTHLRIRDSAGNVIYTNNDISSLDSNSRISFTAPSSGVYFIDVGGFQQGNQGYIGTFELAVETYDPPPVWTITEVAQYLNTSLWIGGGSYAFDAGDGDTITVNITALDAGGQYLARQALAMWSDVTGIAFVEVAIGGQIVFDDDEPGAFGGAFTTGAYITSAEVNVSTQWLADFGTDVGSYAFQTYLHEIGHALGLGHPGEYDGNASFYDNALFENDGWPTTVMSYFSQQDGSYFGDLHFSFAYLGTPMMADIAAMQLLYGLSTTTRTGDTTYGFNSNAGRDAFNAALHPDIAYTIIDSGGIDTLDFSGFAQDQQIYLTGMAYSNVGGLTGNVVIAYQTTIENAVGGSGDDQILGNSADNRLTGGGGDDVLYGAEGNDELLGGAGADLLQGGIGSDTLSGGGGNDTFVGLAAHLNGDVISDFASGDRIVISDATLSTFTFSLTGSTLTYSGGTLTFDSALSGTLVASAASGGGVQLMLGATPPPPVSRAKLLLTQSGQDFVIGGNIAVTGTSSGGEVIEIVRGDVTLDASFNAGGDTVVLPGDAGDYTAVLNGSFVTIDGGDVTVAIPVGLAGLNVQFGDSTRVLRIDTGSGQVVLGTQAITGTLADVNDAGPPLTDPAETGPASLAKLILTASGQDVDIGGNVAITGTTGSGEVITVLGGDVRLDASFNAGGDTVVLPGAAGDYTATLSGSFVTITDGSLSVAIPVGVAGLTVDFSNVDLSLRIDTATGTVRLGDDTVTANAGDWDYMTGLGTKDGYLGIALDDLAGSDAMFAAAPHWDIQPGYGSAIEHRVEINDSFSIG